MPIAITEQQQAIQASIRRWAAGGHTLVAVRNREPGSERGGERCYWDELTDLGLFALAVPQWAGGMGAAAVDVAAALEQVGDALVPGPIMPTMLAGLILGRHADLPGAKEVLPAIAAGSASVAVDFGGLSANVAVLCAGETTHLLLPAGTSWVLVPASGPEARITARTPVDFTRAVGTVEATDLLADLGAGTRNTGPTTDFVRDTAAWLGAVEAAAVAGWCVRTATTYATTRTQFGRPIGTFQAVKHLCAGMLCRAERAVAVAWDAAVAFDEAPDEFPLAAAVAAAVALDAAVDNAKDCVQVLGGIGFTWDHDAHLYLRRAVALRQLLGGAARWRSRVADLVLAGASRGLSVTAGTDETTVDGDAEFRGQVRARIAQVAALPPPDRRAALADSGYLTPHWPAPYGLDAPPARQIVVDEELDRAGLARPELAIAGWAVPTILRFGSPAQIERFAGPSLRGDLTWCQLFSEPEAGSDLAAVRTKAERVDGGWRLTGQKVWTSLAHRADWAICLARTDPAAPKHRGLGYFLVDMASWGVDIRPLREMTGETMFNEVFLDDVFVPDDCLVGASGDGWRLARGTLDSERVAMGRGPSSGEDVRRLVDAVRSAGAVDDPGVRGVLGARIADGHAVSLVDLRGALRRLAGEPAQAESAVAKLIGVAQRQAVAETALEFLGQDGAVVGPESAAVVHEFLLTRCLSIAGGTTQILLTLVADRVLGLPREETRAIHSG